MKTIKYPYNRLQILGYFCAFLPFMIISAREITNDLHTGEIVLWVLYVLVDAELSGFLIWIIFKLITGVKHGSALELDDEKLYYAIQNKTIYWKDISSIGKCNKNITLKTLDGKKTTIRTPWLKANKNLVYDAIAVRVNQ
jgi:hypothetical protein